MAEANPVPEHSIPTAEERATAQGLLDDLVRRPVASSQRRAGRWDSMLRHRGTVGLLASACITAAVVVLALSLGGERPTRSGSGLASGPTAAFPVLNRPRTGSDTLPQPIRRAIKRGSLHMYANSSRLIITTPAVQLWLAPANAGLCIVEQHASITRTPHLGGWGSVGCTDVATAERRGLTAITDTSFTAILPRATSAVRIVFRDGSSDRLVANADGAIARQFNRPVRSVSYTGPTGDAIQLTPGPPPPPPPRSCKQNGPCGTRSPLPKALVRSFSVFAGLGAGQAKMLSNRAGLEISLVPQVSQTCIQWIHPNVIPRGGGGDCVTNSMALAGKMSPTTGGPSGVTVIGLAPNGDATVRLMLPSGSSETVPVHQNVYVARAPHGFRTVTLRDSGGVIRTYHIADGG
jgi:hypothetical protein